MTQYTELQKQVVERAKEILLERYGVKSVCVDMLEADSRILRDGVEDHAEQLVIDTLLWEGKLFTLNPSL